ncbi:MAG: phosphate signaling complex protein PhoU [Actinomycetota bacterium]
MTTSVGDSHIVKSFDAELARLRRTVAIMGGRAERQLRAALAALAARDVEAARQVIADDRALDAADAEINEMAVRVLALRAPVADDLRIVVTALKVSAELERIADLAANVAKRAAAMAHAAPLPAARTAVRLGDTVAGRIADVVAALDACDADAAMAVWHGDAEIDDLYSSLFREILTYMMEDPRTISAATQLMFVAKNLERCGDHATNIAEMVHFLCRGVPVLEGRPKADSSISTSG